jgi:hypothetical protein
LKTKKWNIYEELESVAAEAQKMLNISRETVVDRAFSVIPL